MDSSLRPALRRLLLAACALLGACSGGGAPSAPTPPGVSLRPSDGFLLNVGTPGSARGEPLVIQFGGGMARGSVVLGGTVTADPHASTWSSRAATDDTLTIAPSPQAAWTMGAGRTLHVAGTSADGAVVSTDFMLDVGGFVGDLRVAPAPPSLTTNQPVVVALSFAADPATLVLGGMVLGAGHTLAWAADHGSFTLQPTTGWNAGAGQDLTVQVTGVHSAAVTAQGAYSFDVGGTSPTGALGPPSGGLQPTGPVTVTFSTSMDRATLALGGTLAPSAAAPAWSTVRVADDTVTLTPLTFWPAGTQTLTVDAADLAGHPLLATLSASYQVAVNDRCGTAGGACVNVTDCAFTTAQLGTWTYGCFASHAGDQAATATCVQVNGVTAGCSSCAAAYAACAGAHCLAQCNTGLTSASCVSCLAATACPASFTTCSGRTP